MGLFDAIFGSSKKEQEKPIRDKLKDRKHFEKWLKNTLQEIAEDEISILKAKESGNEVSTFLYYVLDDRNVDVIQIKYSMDASIIELREIYMDSLEYFRLSFEPEEPMYFEILNRVSLGILLNIPDENLMQLVDYVQRMDEEAKPADWTPDLLLWFLLNSRLKDNEKRAHAQKLAFPRLYKGLYKVIQATDSKAALKALKDYIGKWYNLNKDAPWYDSHLKKNCYSGYWAWEVAAVAKIMHIDDTDLKDNPYYPYDMVHWEEDREEQAAAKANDALWKGMQHIESSVGTAVCPGVGTLVGAVIVGLIGAFLCSWGGLALVDNIF